MAIPITPATGTNVTLGETFPAVAGTTLPGSWTLDAGLSLAEGSVATSPSISVHVDSTAATGVSLGLTYNVVDSPPDVGSTSVIAGQKESNNGTNCNCSGSSGADSGGGGGGGTSNSAPGVETGGSGERSVFGGDSSGGSTGTQTSSCPCECPSANTTSGADYPNTSLETYLGNPTGSDSAPSGRVSPSSQAQSNATPPNLGGNMSTATQNYLCDRPLSTTNSVDMSPTGVLMLRTPRVYVKFLGGALDLTTYRVNGNGIGDSTGMPQGKGGAIGTALGSYRHVSDNLNTPTTTNGRGGQTGYSYADGISEKTYAPPPHLACKLTGYDDGTDVTWLEQAADSTYYAYDINGRITSKTPLTGGSVYYEYDGGGRVSRISGDFQGELYFRYDNITGLLDQAVFRDTLGAEFREWDYNYLSDNLSEFIGPEGCVYQYEYDIDGNVIREVDSDNYTTYYEYVPFGTDGTRLSKVIFPTDELSTTYFEFYTGSGELGRTYKKVIDEPALYVYYTYDGTVPVLGAVHGSVDPGTMTPTNICAPWVPSIPTWDGESQLPGNLSPGGTISGWGPGDPTGGIKANVTTNTESCDDNPLTCLPAERKLEGGNMTCSADSAGRNTYYNYDDDHNRIARQDIFGNTTYFAYNVNHRMIRSVAARWPESTGADFTSYYEYDSFGNNTKFTNPLGDSSEAIFQRGGVPTARRDFRGNWTFYSYDAAGRRTSVQDALGHTAQFNYNIFSNRLVTVPPRSIESSASDFSFYYAYDTHDRPIRQKGPEGSLAYFTYGSRCGEGPQTIRQFVQDGWREASFAYDGMARRVQMVDPTGATTHFAYAGATTLVKRRLDPNLNATYYNYDGYHRLGSIENALNETGYFIYDLQQISVIGARWAQGGADAFTTQYIYDAGRLPVVGKNPLVGNYTRLARRIDTQGNTNYFSYDANANLKSAVGARWQESSAADFTWYYTYDRVDRCTTAVDPAGGSQNYFFDPNGNIIATQDPRGSITYYRYDLVNRLDGQTDALQGVSYFGFDAGDNLIASRDPLRNTTYYGYDRLNRKIRALDPVGGAAYYSYNEANNRLAQSGARWPESSAAEFTSYYAYDAMSRRTASRDPARAATYFAYDPNGNQTATVNPRWTESSAAAFTTYYGYDARNRRSSISDPLSNSAYFGYDAHSNLVREVAPRWTESTASAFTSYYGYDTLDRRVAESDPLGNATYFGYDAADNQIQQTGPRWRESSAAAFTTYYAYDSLDRKIRLLDPLRQPAYFAYDPNGNVLRRQDHLPGSTPATTYYGYDALNRNIRTEDALERTTYFGYDAVGNTVRLLEPGDLSRASYFGYDANDRLTRQTWPAGEAMYFGYDLGGNRTRLVGPRWSESGAAAFTTYFVYDNVDNPARNLDPLGGSLYFAYDNAHNLIRWENQRQFTTYYTYDPLDRLTTVRDASGSLWNRALDADGNTLRSLPPAGYAASYFSYDRDGRTLNLLGGGGVASYYAYDAAGNRNRFMLVSGTHTTYFGYDALDRLKAVRNAVGDSLYFAYDVAGNLASSSDPLQHTTYFGYDVLDRVTRVADPLTNTAYFGYDPAGNRCREEDANQHTVYYRYDANNRVVAIEDALNVSSYYAYDAGSNLLKQRDNNGQSVYFNYDALDRKIAQRFDADGYGTQAYGTTPYGGMVGFAQYFAYDSSSNLLTCTLDAWGGSYFEYDALNRTSRRADPAAHALYYAYDGASLLSRLHYPQPPSGSAADVYYTYDAGRRMAGATLVTGSNDSCYYAYDEFGNLARKRYFNNVTCYYTYDDAQRVTSMAYRKGDNTQVGLFTFGRDAAGRVTQMKDQLFEAYYAYDSADRLLSESYRAAGFEVYAFNYDYDAAGNRFKMSKRVFSTLFSSSYFAYNSDNSLLRRKVATSAPSTLSSYYYYDANGAQTSRWDLETGETTCFTYGPQGMITSLTPPSGSAAAWTCAYDARLNRYKQKNGSAAETYEIQEGLKLLEERKTSDDTVTSRNLHGISPVPDIGTIVELQNDLAGTPVNYAPLMDHRGSVFALLDATGNVVAERQYNAFGEIIYSSGAWGSAGSPVAAGYQTNWQTVKIGSKYYCISAARVYDPELGIFLNRDLLAAKIKIAQNRQLDSDPSKFGGAVANQAWGLRTVDYCKWFLNLYRAWSNNPVSDVDNTGLASSDPPIQGPQTPSPLEPGPFRKEPGVPVGPGRLTADQKRAIQMKGAAEGCETCGTRFPGKPGDKWIGNHWPAQSECPETFKAYPHCKKCSAREGYLRGIGKPPGPEWPVLTRAGLIGGFIEGMIWEWALRIESVGGSGATQESDVHYEKDDSGNYTRVSTIQQYDERQTQRVEMPPDWTPPPPQPTWQQFVDDLNAGKLPPIDNKQYMNQGK